MEYRAARQVTACLSPSPISTALLHRSTFHICLKFTDPSFIPDVTAFYRSSGCHFCPVQTWLWTLCGAVTSPSALKTSSTVRIWPPPPHLQSPRHHSEYRSWHLFCSVPLQIQLRVKWWVIHTWWWSTNWDCCERKTDMENHIDAGLILESCCSQKGGVGVFWWFVLDLMLFRLTFSTCVWFQPGKHF